ncbi:MAG: U32 family peptidase [Oscillospiraceae bacterium]|nr:U32 family peptidase [Oscillospiraceae bacterium]
MIELLSPAGSMEALRAAVQNGADAVYLGYGDFNARRNAKNFNAEELREAICYCHVRGVQVHMTLNIVVSDKEMRRAAETIHTAAALGIDAFIVQDPGVVALCRQIAPHVPIHASTQMSIHSLEGVLQAAQMGCSRVVLARELPKEEIAFICQNSPVEIEVFVHGALCMCYSGQCYLSSVIGSRSGNRGQCAQPCRMAYGYGRYEESRYPLSLKDNCLVEHLHELHDMGVKSIKIEGRMKRPEYVAIVTRIYRSVLDGKPVTEQDLQELEAAFSRQGFTKGYYEGKTGSHMFGIHLDEQPDEALFASARESYERGENPRVPVQFYAIVKPGEESQLAVEDDRGNVCRTRGPVPEIGRMRELTKERLTEQLCKTGGTPYYCAGARIMLDQGLMLSASAINAMRREVLDQLTALRGRVELKKMGRYSELAPYDGVAGEAKLTVCVRTADQITAKLLSMSPAVLYVPLSELLEHPEVLEKIPVETELTAVLPRVIRDTERTAWASALAQAERMGVRHVLTGNLGQLRLAQSKGFGVRGDFGLNVYNSRTMHYLREHEVESQLLSFEMTLPQIRDISKAVPVEVLVYGRLPLMLMENCVIKNRTGVCSCDSPTKLIDRMGEEFPVLKDPGTCRNVLYNGKKLYMLDKLDRLRGMGIWAHRLNFTTENPAEVDAVLSQYYGRGEFDPGTCTRGLYARGVE